MCPCRSCSLRCLKGAIKAIAGQATRLPTATTSADNIEEMPVLGSGMMVKSSEYGKYQNNLVNKIGGTRPIWHIKEQAVPIGPADLCSRVQKGGKLDTEGLQMKLCHCI